MRRAVVRIIAPSVRGQAAGSGVLVNNGLGMVGVPYVVTAAHLLDFDDDGDIEDAEGSYFGQNVEVAFGLESACGGGPAATPFVVQGATVLSIDEVFDIVLLQLFVSPDDLVANADPYFVGWDRSNPDLPLDVHTIHHPCSDVKMVAGGEAPTNFNGYLQLDGLSCGGIQAGSSGGPLFNTATRALLGVLSGTIGGDGGIFPEGEVCAGEHTSILFAPFTPFASQFLGAQDIVPAYDPP